METNTQVISQGNAARGFAAGLKQIAVNVAGFTNTYVALFSGMKDALEAYCEAAGCDSNDIPVANPAPFAIRWTGNHYDERFSYVRVQYRTSYLYIMQ